MAREPIRMELEDYPCHCPGTPHSIEWVELEPAPTIPMGMAAMRCLQRFEGDSADAFYGELSPLLMRFGIRGWSFSGVKGESIEVNPDSISELLPFGRAGYAVANKCMGLYIAEIMLPLAVRRSKQLDNGPMESTTPPTPTSGSMPPTSPSRSSHKRTAGKPSGDPVQ